MKKKKPRENYAKNVRPRFCCEVFVRGDPPMRQLGRRLLSVCLGCLATRAWESGRVCDCSS